jgi:hypothetical protein
MSAAESPWMTPAEVSELTGLLPNSWAAQRRKLLAMGVPFRPNAAGRPLVERATVLTTAQPRKPRKGPNWDAINGTAA